MGSDARRFVLSVSAGIRSSNQRSATMTMTLLNRRRFLCHTGTLAVGSLTTATLLTGAHAAPTDPGSETEPPAPAAPRPGSSPEAYFFRLEAPATGRPAVAPAEKGV